MNPLVSVIIPTHNRRALLDRAVQSVLQQTLQEWELVIVDDGSDDGTADLCRGYLCHPRVRYRFTARQGVSASRNEGIRLARAPWLAFLDSDDSWMPDKLSRQIDAVESSGDRVCHTEEIWIRCGRRVNARRRHRKPQGWIFPECLPLCAVSPSSVLLHRTVLDQVGVFDESYEVCEDYELWLRVACQFRVTLVDEPLVIKFGGHADQLSRLHWGMDRWRARALYACRLRAALSEPWQVALQAELDRKLSVLARGYRNRGKELESCQLENFAAALLRGELPELPDVLRSSSMLPPATPHPIANSR